MAKETVLKDSQFPAGAKIASYDEADVYALPSAARVDLPYEYKDASGTTKKGSYTVWLKRIARTWVLDRYYPSDAPSKSVSSGKN